MTVKFFVPSFTDKMRQAAIDAMDNERPIMGESVHKFEERFAVFVGVRNAVAVNSGTMALQLTLEALGVEGGDVVTSPTSFVATSNAILHAGAAPVFADVDYNGNIHRGSIEEVLSAYTKAVLPVHLYGCPSDMAPILDLAEKREIPVIEDACQAHGAKYGNKMVGSIGEAGCFSFYTTKNMMVGGDGGMVTTNNDKLAEKIRSLANCGRSSDNASIHERIGHTSRLNSIQAAIGLAALEELPGWLEARRRHAKAYLDGLKDTGLRLPHSPSVVQHAYHLFVVRSQLRNSLRWVLNKKNIETGVHYNRVIPDQPAYNGNKIYMNKGGIIKARQHAATCLSLPMHPNLTDEEVQYVCESIRKYGDSS